MSYQFEPGDTVRCISASTCYSKNLKEGEFYTVLKPYPGSTLLLEGFPDTAFAVGRFALQSKAPLFYNNKRLDAHAAQFAAGFELIESPCLEAEDAAEDALLRQLDSFIKVEQTFDKEFKGYDFRMEVVNKITKECRTRKRRIIEGI